MLTKKASFKQIEEWKKVYEQHHLSMLPNRKSGSEVNDYFKSKYPYHVYDNEDFKNVVAFNIIHNEHTRRKLQNERKPDIKCYRVDDILIGIDIVSGEFHIESEEIENIVPIYDDLFVYRGLDKEDLKNYFLVAEYIRLKKANI